MKPLQGLVLALTATLASAALAASKDEVIQEALKKGAVIVVCDNGLCKNSKTQEIVGQGENGTFLLYPPGHEQEEVQTARLLARAE
jgi:hypothetical protein